MWIHKLFSVLVLISIGQASYRPGPVYAYEDTNERPNFQSNENNIFVPGDDGSDARRFFSYSHSLTPGSSKVKAGFDLFGIPIGPQFSYTKETKEKEVTPPLREVVKVYVPIRTIINDGGYGENYAESIVQVPVKQLKQNLVSTVYAKHPAPNTFPWAHDSRRAAVVSDYPTSRNQKVTAALELFGMSIGPQYIYDSDKNHKGYGATAEKESYGMDKPLLPNIEQMVRKLVREFNS